MISQELYNIVVAVAGFFGGFLMYALWGLIKQLQTDDRALTLSIGNLEKIVIGDYVKRVEMDKMVHDMRTHFEQAMASQTTQFEKTMERFMQQDLQSHNMILNSLAKLEQKIDGQERLNG